MEIVIDFSSISSSPLVFAWWFFKTIGWIFPAIFFIQGLLIFWQTYLRSQYRKTRKYILLAIDVPKENEQTPKAVENIFNHLAGAHKPLRFVDKWWFGEIPESFSFEIVSLGGYIQFIIHTPEELRDLVEAMIYAQYPNAEITEIEDYTKDWNIKFPNNQYDLWGTEIVLAKKEFYPIRTYKEFEDSASKETYKDSMAALLEALTRIGPGEQIWVQFVVTPADNDWGEGAQRLINKLIGAKDSGGGGFDPIGSIGGAVAYFFDAIFSNPETVKKDSGKSEPNQLLYLTAGEKDNVDAIEKKIAKLGFHTRIRAIYLAEKNKFNKPIGNAIYGSFKQFNTLNLNSFKPDKRYLTGGVVYFKPRRLLWRKNKILWLYKQRGHYLDPGTYGKILNTEELASVYHFPTLVVKAPLVQKAEVKKGEPPITLPREKPMSFAAGPRAGASAAAAVPPENLPTG